MNVPIRTANHKKTSQMPTLVDQLKTRMVTPTKIAHRQSGRKLNGLLMYFGSSFVVAVIVVQSQYILISEYSNQHKKLTSSALALRILLQNIYDESVIIPYKARKKAPLSEAFGIFYIVLLPLVNTAFNE